MTVGTISARTGIGKGTLFSEYARLSEILKPCTERLLELYRLAPVKGADETTWRCDGQNGYVYGFFTQDVALSDSGELARCVSQKRSLAKVITSVSWCATDFLDKTTHSRESSNIASSILSVTARSYWRKSRRTRRITE